MVDLDVNLGKAEQKKPKPLTFEDIQNMQHYSKLNTSGKADDEFRPQDFLDMDSADDSDNEILMKFKIQ